MRIKFHALDMNPFSSEFNNFFSDFRLADSEQNTDQAKKSKRDSQTEQKRQLEQERVLLNESFTQRLSVARKK